MASLFWYADSDAEKKNGVVRSVAGIGFFVAAEASIAGTEYGIDASAEPVISAVDVKNPPPPRPK